MILIGVCRQSKRAEVGLAVAEAALSGGRKRYSFLEIDDRQEADPEAFVQEIHRRLKDGGLWRRKRLFSQDRRPKKILTDRPKVVALEDGAGTIDGLRNRGVVVEAIRFSAVEKWEKELVGKALGANYTVAPGHILTAAAAVFEEGRVDVPLGQGKKEGAERVIDRISRKLAAAKGAQIDGLPASALAVALVLWFRETVPYRRAYRAN
ncbi:MAG: hypothetical protein K9L59_06405 [Desulfobacterales bacterium]|nr:hypothetical protein [Desulfobacterales bacterium]